MDIKYFNKLPKVLYDINKDGNWTKIPNIFTRFSVLPELLDNDYATYEYYIEEGLTIEEFAKIYYGDQYYHWLILLTNNAADKYAFWPMDTNDFIDYLNETYADNEDKSNGQQRANQKIHHYEDFYGNIIHRDTYLEKLETPGSEPPRKITYYDYEYALNEKKRHIKILNKDQLEPFMKQMDEMLKINYAEIEV